MWGWEASPCDHWFGQRRWNGESEEGHAKALYLRSQYQNSYIAPELASGIGRPSIESLIKTVYKLPEFQRISTVEDALTDSPKDRPSISDLKEALSRADDLI